MQFHVVAEEDGSDEVGAGRHDDPAAALRGGRVARRLDGLCVEGSGIGNGAEVQDCVKIGKEAPIPDGFHACQDVVSTDKLRNNEGIIGRSAGTDKRSFRQRGFRQAGMSVAPWVCRTLRQGGTGIPACPPQLKLVEPHLNGNRLSQ